MEVDLNVVLLVTVEGRKINGGSVAECTYVYTM